MNGIVTTGEGRYSVGIVVMLRLLREVLHCNIPVQVWHNGPFLHDYDTKQDPYTVFVDMREFVRVGHPMSQYGGWASKTAAVIHSGFDRVLFLDADSYCVADPTPLFKLLDEHRLVIWCDYGPGSACGETLSNAVCNLPHQNGGEYLINLNTYWCEFQAQRFLDNYSDIWYREGRLGDECSTRLVRSIIQDRGVLRADWVKRTRGVGILCKYDGVDYVAHRMRRESKLFPGSFPRSNSYWPLEEEVLEYFSALSPGYQIPSRTTGDPKRDAVVANRSLRLATAGRGTNVQLKATVARRLARINAARR